MLGYFNDLGVEGTYLYDYGDGWEHRVKLEGKRAYPPEERRDPA